MASLPVSILQTEGRVDDRTIGLSDGGRHIHAGRDAAFETGDVPGFAAIKGETFAILVRAELQRQGLPCR